MRRQWTINGRFLAQPLTGVQRYALETVRALDGLIAGQAELARGLEVELVLPPDAVHSPALRAIGMRTVGRGGGHAWEQTALPRAVAGGLLSLCNTGPLSVRKQIVCIHDANARRYPASYSLPFRSLYRVLMPALGHTARRIATVSQHSADELVALGIAPRRKIFVAPNGHEHVGRWEPRFPPGWDPQMAANMIVIIGSNAPHKNIGLILRMADRLAREKLSVAVVGMADARVFQANLTLPDAANVHWLGRLSDGELAGLLGHAMCLAFPSFVEGFGLPPLEAMALGCPVVSSDRASMPEICGEAALFAAPDDPEGWLRQFIRLRDDPALRRAMAERGLTQAARFRWQASAERYLEAMAAADGVGAAPAGPAEHNRSAALA